MKFGVVVFPGPIATMTVYANRQLLRKPVEFIWHQIRKSGECDAIILPRISYGDFICDRRHRAFFAVMKSVEKFAKQGGMVLGVCNGFPDPLRSGPVPGAMHA